MVEWIEIQRVKKEGLVIRSPPSWWSGLKFTVKIDAYTHGNVSTLVVEWIEMEMCYMRPGWRESPPSWWSGLKLRMAKEIEALPPSPPSWWSGLKSVWYPCILIGINVSTLVVEWIEIG